MGLVRSKSLKKSAAKVGVQTGRTQNCGKQSDQYKQPAKKK